MTVQPDWLDKQAYPFTSHTLNLDAGQIHYADEGTGETVLMVHGTPMWSFLYRHLIHDLRDDYRVIALDKPGFGLSDRPTDYGYTPAEQAATLAAFIQALDLRDITLVVHDFGGPTGLSYALDHPQHVKRLVLFNTWMWSLRGDWPKRLVGGFLSSPLGRMLCLRYNLEVNVIVPGAYGRRSRLTKAIHDQYRRASADETARWAIWVYARELLASAEWYDSLWARREALRDIPALLLWGMKDPVFTPSYLARWQTLFPDAKAVTFPDSGHFVQEEVPDEALPHLRAFLSE